jgi:hypothetical protein
MSTYRQWRSKGDAGLFDERLTNHLFFPSSFFVEQMYFYGNQFTGTVPNEWGQLSDLEFLEMQQNNINGLIPESVCLLRVQKALDSLIADCVNCPIGGLPCCHQCVDENGDVVILG